MNRERAVWLLNRLRAMGPLEILRRCRNELYAFAQGRGYLLAPDPPVPDFSRRSAVFVPETEGMDAAEILRVADRLLDQGMDVFTLTGIECVNPQWNRDPFTGIDAPLNFGKKINFKDRNLCGDIKYLWEPGRFLQAVPPALAWRVSGNEKYLRAVRSMIESWLEQCPYMLGVHWASSLELGIRLINWSLAWQYVGGLESPMFEGEQGRAFRDRWLKSIHQHLHFINGWYSQGSSANNHLIGEAAGVFIGCCTWPFRDGCGSWKKRALGILETQARKQVWPDGAGKEQTLSYQRFVLDFMVLAHAASPQSYSEEYCAILERMAGFIHAMSDEHGNAPMIGDADDGLVCGLSLIPGNILSPARPCDTELQDSFPQGGYHIFRDEQAGLFAVVDCGPLGFGSLAAHGHADALSLYLAVGGVEFLIDPGTYVYGSDPFWREYFRGTSAHNTVRIDGLNQSESGGDFLWTSHARAQGNVERAGDIDSFRGSHDGYQRLEDPLGHRRVISFKRQERCISVRDELLCTADHSAEQFWHFSEDCRVEVVSENKVVAENSGIRISMKFAAGVRLKLFHGDESKPLGWVSRRFGVKTPSTTLVAEAALAGDTVLSVEIFY
ncbi:alginate lyase family protein [Desulfovibrio sp. JC010]|uniref:heparinase II/III family protein n=1 Tax=Desulfovibrio sp. JC010 TaxID=2593641 RepID=UPI0013D218F2|nr:alginate lyase family protein [Desulfovibrio sp. JC010]NDV26504.1 heparinase [Desulfovibrio sp. JC010]